MHDRIQLWDQRGALAIAEATQRTKNEFYPSTQNQPKNLMTWQTGTIEARSTTTITACNGNTYGVGTAQPYISQYNSNTNSYTAVQDNSYGNGNTNTVTVLNWSTTTNGVPSGTNIGITWRNGVFLLAFVDCGN